MVLSSTFNTFGMFAAHGFPWDAGLAFAFPFLTFTWKTGLGVTFPTFTFRI